MYEWASLKLVPYQSESPSIKRPDEEDFLDDRSGDADVVQRLPLQPTAKTYSKISKIGKFCKILPNFLRARSRLYQNEILQENNIQNMRSTAFFKLYKICILLHRCNLKIFAKNRFEKSANFVKIQQKF